MFWSEWYNKMTTPERRIAMQKEGASDNSKDNTNVIMKLYSESLTKAMADAPYVTKVDKGPTPSPTPKMDIGPTPSPTPSPTTNK
jgi:hypothetical protein